MPKQEKEKQPRPKVTIIPGRGVAQTINYLLEDRDDLEWIIAVGRTKNGEYTQAQRLAQDAMLASGYTPVMESELLRRAWAKWAEVSTVLDVFRKATNFAEVVPAVYQPWYPRWSDAINVELTACLSGKITADQACDNMITALATAKRA